MYIMMQGGCICSTKLKFKKARAMIAQGYRFNDERVAQVMR